MSPHEIIAGLWLAVWPALGAVALSTVPTDTSAPIHVSAKPAGTQESLLELSDDDLLDRIKANPASLGPLSIGAPSSAVLLYPVQLASGPRWETAPGADSWGTAETIAGIQTAIDTVHQLFPDGTPQLVIGDISDPDGGRLKRHQTHQGGRDADLGFYYKGGKSQWFVNGTAANMDLPRNWALVRALVVRTDVETILLDTRVQRLLYQFALASGEDKGWLDRVFQFSKGASESIIRHVAGHRNHYHVRFFSPLAQELGRRAHPMLVQLKLMNPPVFTVQHVVQPGQTLGALARRYGTTVGAIQRANGLTSTQLRAGRAYRIPVKSVAPVTQPFVLPHRVLPAHTPDAIASVDWPTQESLYGQSGATR